MQSTALCHEPKTSRDVAASTTSRVNALRLGSEFDTEALRRLLAVVDFGGHLGLVHSDQSYVPAKN
jgi:hypothetical protein